jgi:ankyrin repeat protein
MKLFLSYLVALFLFGGLTNCVIVIRPREIHDAAFSGFLQDVQALIDEGADVNALPGEPYGLLHIAALNNRPDIVRLLLSKGADVDARNSECRTALHIAAAAGSTDSITLLLENGADIEAVQQNHPARCTPLAYAVYSGEIDSLKFLLGRGANLKVTRGNIASLRSAGPAGGIRSGTHGSGIEVDARDDESNTPLILAALIGQVEMYPLFIVRGSTLRLTLVSFGSSKVERESDFSSPTRRYSVRDQRC